MRPFTAVTLGLLLLAIPAVAGDPRSEADLLVLDASASADPARAARLYGQALRLDPSHETALRGLGRALLDQDRPADSLKVARRLHAIRPDDPDVLLHMATATIRLPEPRRADILEGLAWAETAAHHQPDAPQAWYMLSILRFRNGEYGPAADAARRAVDLDALRPVAPDLTARYQQQEIACNDALSVFSPLD